MSKATDALIARERVRQPKRMAKLERRLARGLAMQLDRQAAQLAVDVAQGAPLEDLQFAVYDSAIASQLERDALETWKEFADPDSIDRKALSDIPAKIARQLRKEAGEAARLIGGATKRRVERILNTVDDAGDSPSLASLAGMIRDKLGGKTAKSRAKNIANDQIAYTANSAADQAARDAGMKFKIWTTARDERVRKCHQSAHGQKVKLSGGIFTVCGDKFRFPKDRTFGPAIGNVINCRCHCVYTRR